MPTELERKGDFSQSFTTQLVRRRAGRSTRFSIYDPLAVDSKGNRKQFSGNVILPESFDPIAKNILAYIPLPNTAGDGTSSDSNNFAHLPPAGHFSGISGRVDQNWNNSQHSFVTVNWSHLTEITGDNFGNIANGTNRIRNTKRIGT